MTNLINRRFGSLIVVGCAGQKENRGRYFWHCICDCGGGLKSVRGDRLVSKAIDRCRLCTFANNKNGRWNGGRPKKGQFPKTGFGVKAATKRKYKRLAAKMLRETGDIC